MSVVGTNSLQAPRIQKLPDPDVERNIRELEAKVVELQNINRALIAAIIALGGSV